GRIDLHGALQEFTLPNSGTPEGICEGPDGNMWFTESDGMKVGRITPDGDIREYPIPSANLHPHAIALGPDGNLWVVERGVPLSKIAKLEVHVPGDVNDDGVAYVSDVFYLINYLFAGGPAPN